MTKTNMETWFLQWGLHRIYVRMIVVLMVTAQAAIAYAMRDLLLMTALWELMKFLDCLGENN